MKGELKLSPADFRRYFKEDWAKFASSLYLPRRGESNQIELDLRYMQDFIVDTIRFIFELAESAVNKKIILYPHNAFSYGYGASPKDNLYLPPADGSLNEWSTSVTGSVKDIGFMLDLKDQNSIDKFVEMLPILLGNLLVRPATFIVRDPDYIGLESDHCKFTFDMTGSLLPSQMVGGGRDHHSGPPTTGMRWTDGNEADYIKSDFYLKWNAIISRHDILSVSKPGDPNEFYEICREILFVPNFFYKFLL